MPIKVLIKICSDPHNIQCTSLIVYAGELSGYTILDLSMITKIKQDEHAQRSVKFQVTMSFLVKAKALPVTLTMSSDGLQNLGFRFKEIKSTFFDLERQHNQDEIRKTQSYKLIANLRSLNIF